MGAFRDSMRERALEKAQAKRNGFLQKINSQKGRICVCFSSPSSTKDLQDIDNSINQFLLEYPELKIVTMTSAIGITGKVICYFEKV